MPRVETLTASRNLLSPHVDQEYPGLLTYRVDGWPSVFVIPEPGQTVVALGGEEAYGYETTDGVRADPIRLGKGDRATVASWDAPSFLAVWRVERAE